MTPADLDEVQRIVDDNGIEPATVWIMPEGGRLEDLLRHPPELYDAIIERGWNITTRLHVIAWGGRRGK